MLALRLDGDGMKRYEVSVTLNVALVVTVEAEDMESLRDNDYNLTDDIIIGALSEDIQSGQLSFDLTVDDAWQAKKVTA